MKRIFPKDKRGMALLAVLWALAILSLAVVSLGVLLESTMSQQTSLLSTTRALLAAESGLEMAKNPAVNASNYRDAIRQLNAELYPAKGGSGKDGISFSVELQREGGLLDLNRLAADPGLCREVLNRLFQTAWGVNPQTADRAISGLIDWVDPDDSTQLNGAERRFYERARLPGPRNGPMRGREEFMMIYGWRELQNEVRKKRGIDLRKRFTAGGAEKLDLMGAEGDLIEAVLGVAKERANSWTQERKGPDGMALTSDDVQDPGAAARILGVTIDLLNDRTTLQGRLRVLSTGKVGETTRTIEAVLSDGTPRKVEARWLQ